MSKEQEWLVAAMILAIGLIAAIELDKAIHPPKQTQQNRSNR